jgi:hypothetical protein
VVNVASVIDLTSLPCPHPTQMRNLLMFVCSGVRMASVLRRGGATDSRAATTRPAFQPGGTSAGGRLYRIDVESCARDQPGDHRVGIPHLTCTKLVDPRKRESIGRTCGS